MACPTIRSRRSLRRPIGWITTMSAKGESILRPIPFNGITDHPPIVMFSSEGPSFGHLLGDRNSSAAATYDLRNEMNKIRATAAASTK